MERKHYKRKIINFSVKKHLQLRLFVKVLGVAVVGIGIMAAIFYFYSNREINDSYKQFHIHAKNFLDYLLPAVVLSLIAAVIFAIGITMFFPLRIAGPLFRIERDLKEKVSEGDLTVRFKLRPGDEVEDLADSINMSLEKLGARIKSIRAATEKLTSRISAEDKEASELIKELNNILKEFKLRD